MGQAGLGVLPPRRLIQKDGRSGTLMEIGVFKPEISRQQSFLCPQADMTHLSPVLEAPSRIFWSSAETRKQPLQLPRPSKRENKRIKSTRNSSAPSTSNAKGVTFASLSCNMRFPTFFADGSGSGGAPHSAASAAVTIILYGEFTSLSLAFKINILIKRAGECFQGKCLFIFFPRAKAT